MSKSEFIHQRKLLTLKVLLVNKKYFFSLILSLFILLAFNKVYAESKVLSHPDIIPEMSVKGIYDVGVITHSIVNSDYIDPLSQSRGRSLPIEVWYPAINDKQSNKTPSLYTNVLRSGKAFSMQGDAIRDAKFNHNERWPLVVLSHGYTGYRTIMFYLGEHLASHGYVVVGIDHTDSTNAEINFTNAPFAGFISTLLHRSYDQLMVLNYFAENQGMDKVTLSRTGWSPLKAGILGYSMGGYGLLNTIGACLQFSDTFMKDVLSINQTDLALQLQNLLSTCHNDNASITPTSNNHIDPKWQAAIAIAPWGAQHSLFNKQAVADVTVPLLLISGNQDDISDYLSISSLFEQFQQNDRYMLTLINARHNIAPHITPEEAWSSELDFGHYYEPAWDGRQLNNINKHFSLSMFNCYLKNDNEACTMLDLSHESHQRAGLGKLAKPWNGFDHRYSTGMQWRQEKAVINNPIQQ